MKRFALLSVGLALCLLCACAAPEPVSDCPICTAPTAEERIAAVENCAAYLSMSTGDAQLTIFLDARNTVLTIHGDNDIGTQLAAAVESGPLSQVLPALLTAAQDAGHLSDGDNISMLACTPAAAERDLLMAYHEAVDKWLCETLPTASSEVLPSYLLSAQ